MLELNFIYYKFSKYVIKLNNNIFKYLILKYAFTKTIIYQIVQLKVNFRINLILILIKSWYKVFFNFISQSMIFVILDKFKPLTVGKSDKRFNY